MCLLARHVVGISSALDQQAGQLDAVGHAGGTVERRFPVAFGFLRIGPEGVGIGPRVEQQAGGGDHTGGLLAGIPEQREKHR